MFFIQAIFFSLSEGHHAMDTSQLIKTKFSFRKRQVKMKKRLQGQTLTGENETLESGCHQGLPGNMEKKNTPLCKQRHLCSGTSQKDTTDKPHVSGVFITYKETKNTPYANDATCALERHQRTLISHTWAASASLTKKRKAVSRNLTEFHPTLIFLCGSFA